MSFFTETAKKNPAMFPVHHAALISKTEIVLLDVRNDVLIYDIDKEYIKSRFSVRCLPLILDLFKFGDNIAVIATDPFDVHNSVILAVFDKRGFLLLYSDDEFISYHADQSFSFITLVNRNGLILSYGIDLKPTDHFFFQEAKYAMRSENEHLYWILSDTLHLFDTKRNQRIEMPLQIPPSSIGFASLSDGLPLFWQRCSCEVEIAKHQYLVAIKVLAMIRKDNFAFPAMTYKVKISDIPIQQILFYQKNILLFITESQIVGADLDGNQLFCGDGQFQSILKMSIFHSNSQEITCLQVDQDVIRTWEIRLPK